MSYIGNEPIVSATRTITEITATAGQTVFVANGGYTVGYIDVFVNGAQLQTSDFTATNGSSITLSAPAQSGDDIRLVAWGTFQTSGAVQKAGDTMSGNLAVPSLQIGGQGVSGHYGMKNRIINGAMMIDQRNNGASVTPTTDGQYTLDRFKIRLSQASRLSVQRNAGSVTPPAGFVNYLGITSLSAFSAGTSDYFGLMQNIEGFNIADWGFGTSSATPITLSFWVRSSVAGQFSGILYNDGNSRNINFTYTINATNTWEYKTVTIAGDTAGTWQSNNNNGLQIWWDLGSGSSNTGAAVTSWAASAPVRVTGSQSIVATNGATFYITGVQLEKGSTATSFDYRPYGTELALCQRYCMVYRSIDSADKYTRIGLGPAEGGTTTICQVRITVPLRASPSVTTSGTFIVYDGATITDVTGINISSGGSSYAPQLNALVASGLTTTRIYELCTKANGNGILTLSAEL